MTARSLSLLLAALVFGSALGGCEEDPSVIRTDLAFSLYGYLDPTADRQAVRVVRIGETIGADTSLTIDAVVASVEAGTGIAATWRDSVVTYADGSIGHVFVADYTPTPGELVTFTVTETDVAEPRTATVEIAVPPLAQARIQIATTSGAQVIYPIEVRGVPNIIGGTLRLLVTGFPAAPADTTVLTVTEVDVDIEEIGPNDWRVSVPFLSATRTYLQQQNLLGSLALVAAEFGAFVANDAWAVPPGGFDLDAIVEPGTFTNVEGGFGFVGAGYEAPVRWTPSIATQSRAGFRITDDPASLLVINEISLTADGWIEIYNPATEPIEIGGYQIIQDPVSDALPDASYDITDRVTVPARGFAVIDTDLAFQGDDRVTLVSAGGAEATRTFIADDASGTAQSYGSFPDGRRESFSLGGGAFLYPFQGPLTPTRGGPNQLDFQPAAINEISTAGADGWVEAITLPGGAVSGMRVLSVPERALEATPLQATPGSSFFVADEGGPAFALEQTGGEVFLYVDYQVVEGGAQSRVVDYRSYGPQDPTRSIGYLPDGPSGTWREGLIPTRAASNAATGRLGAW